MMVIHAEAVVLKFRLASELPKIRIPQPNHGVTPVSEVGRESAFPSEFPGKPMADILGPMFGGPL